MRFLTLKSGALLGALGLLASLAGAVGSPARVAGGTLSRYTARRSGTGAELQWKTAFEQNTLRFDVERSTNGTTFAAVGRVPAAGNSRALLDYAFADASAPRDVPIYYRLVLVDRDSTRLFSPILSLPPVPAPVVLPRPALYPNPSSGTGTLGITNAPPEVPVRLVDRLGRIRASGTTDANGTAQLPLPPNLGPAVYVVRCGKKYAHWVVCY